MLIKDKALEPYQIEATADSCNVLTKVVSEEGNPYTKTLAYCTNMESAIKKIIRLKTHLNTKTVTLSEYLLTYREVSESVIKAMRKRAKAVEL